MNKLFIIRLVSFKSKEEDIMILKIVIGIYRANMKV